MSIHLIHYMRSITPDTLAGLQNVSLSALNQGATELHVHLSSDGGANDQGFAAYHFLRSFPIPITMHCIGNVESMAVILYLAGERRLIVPHGKVKIHPMLWGFPGGGVDHDRLAEFAASLDFDAKRYGDIYEERTKEALNRVDVRSHLAGQAKLLTAGDALSAGISTEIVDATIPPAAIRWWV